MLIGSDGQYDNKNATVYATSMHTNSLVEYPPPTHEKAVISRPNPTQPNPEMDPTQVQL